MKQSRLFRLAVLSSILFYGAARPGLAQSADSSKQATVEERLAAIENKLRNLESRIDVVQGNGQVNGTQNAASSESAAAAPVADRLESLDKKLRVFERRRELKQESTATKIKESPIVTASGKDGFSLKSADSNFQLKVGG